MHDTEVRSVAVARRKRMDRRRFERRFKRGASLVAVLYVLAMIVAPERATLSAAPTPAVRVAALPLATYWRPSLISRKKGYALQKTEKPFTKDTTENLPHRTLTRWHRIYKFASKYNITADLSRKIYDAALTQKLEPDLGFRVVQMESEFKSRALSPVGAIGLTQLMLPTARGFEPAVTREALTDPETNLRIGFKYLRALIRENDGNLSLALLVYNRGPVAVQSALALGQNPSNGYDREVTKGYRGRGVLD